MAVSLAVIPIGLSHFGEVRFGVWLTIASIVQIVAFADLGIGNALMTTVSSEPEGTATAARPWVSNGVFLLTSTGFCFGVIFAVVGINLDWGDLLGVATTPEVVALLAVTAVVVTLSLPASVTEKTLWGLQLGHIASWWQIAASAVTVMCAILVAQLGGNLALYGLAILGPPLIAALASGRYSFRHVIPDALPRFEDLSRERVEVLMKIGGFYFGLQLIGVLAFSSDNLIVAHTLGVSAVTSLAVPARMFGMITLLLSTALMPLWPAYGQALANNDGDWVVHVFSRSVAIAAAVTISGGAVAIVFGPKLIAWWVGPDFTVEPGILAALTGWIAIQAFGTSIAMLFNAARVFKFQLVTGGLMAVMSIALKIALTGQFGIVAIPLITTIAYGSLVLAPSIWRANHLIRHLRAGQLKALDSG